jgi:hypothetical protein
MFDGLMNLVHSIRCISFQGFTTFSLICMLVFNTAFASWLDGSDCLCLWQRESSESPVEEQSHLLLTVPSSPRRGGRQEVHANLAGPIKLFIRPRYIDLARPIESGTPTLVESYRLRC